MELIAKIRESALRRYAKKKYWGTRGNNWTVGEGSQSYRRYEVYLCWHILSGQCNATIMLNRNANSKKWVIHEYITWNYIKAQFSSSLIIRFSRKLLSMIIRSKITIRSTKIFIYKKFKRYYRKVIKISELFYFDSAAMNWCCITNELALAKQRDKRIVPTISSRSGSMIETSSCFFLGFDNTGIYLLVHWNDWEKTQGLTKKKKTKNAGKWKERLF